MHGARLVLNLPGLIEQTVNVKVEQSCDGVIPTIIFYIFPSGGKYSKPVA